MSAARIAAELSEAAAALAAQQARIAELEAKLDRSSAVWTAMNERQASEWRRAERAEARVAELEASDGWAAFYKLRRQVGDARYPDMTAHGVHAATYENEKGSG